MIHPSHRPVYVTNNFYNERYVSTYTYTQQQQQQTYKESDAAKKDLKSIMEADGGDESLKKYKEQLLGAAAKGKVGSGERVVIEEFDFDFEKADLTKEMIQELIYNEMCVFHEEYRQNLKKVVESRGRKYEKNKIVLAPQS